MLPLRRSLPFIGFAALACCMADPTKRGCKSRAYGPTQADVVEATNRTNTGWTLGDGAGSCVAAADMPPTP